MNPTEGAQKVSQAGPKTLDSVDMNFSDTIPVIVTCPLVAAVTDGVVGSSNPFVAAPLIGIDRGESVCIAMDMREQGFLVCVFDHTQSYLSRLSSHGAHHRRAVVVIGTVTALFVGSASGWVSRVEMTLPFFPPRSGTSRRSQYVHLRGVRSAVTPGRSPESPYAVHAQWCG